MTTPRDLMIVALTTTGGGRSVGQGELSLALAGAELADLVDVGAAWLDGERVRPGPPTDTRDALLGEAAAGVHDVEPYESVDDWLWRRGRGLAARYFAAFESEGLLERRRRLLVLRAGDVAVAESDERRAALDRWSWHEPVLTALGTAAGLEAAGLAGPDDAEDPNAGPVAVVLASVQDAVAELAAVRQRKSIEQAAFDNVWRAG